MKKSLLLAGLIVFTVGIFGADVVLYQDDFSNPKRYGQEWKRTDGSWKYDLAAKTFRQSIGAPHRVGKIYLKKEIPSNIEISYDFKYLGGKSVNGFGSGIILQFPGVNMEGASYQIGIPTFGQKKFSISKVAHVIDNGKLKNKYKTLAVFDCPVLELGKKYNLKLRVEDNIFTLTVDGEEMFEFEDKDNSIKVNGKMFGFSTYGVSADFDNLVIREIK